VGSIPGVSLKFFIYIIFPAALWPSNPLKSDLKRVPEIFPRGKRNCFVVLTTSPTSFADCLEFNFLEPYRDVIGKYRECVSLVSPVWAKSVSPVVLKVGHKVPERATPRF
jgi:hypothetical protein